MSPDLKQQFFRNWGFLVAVAGGLVFILIIAYFFYGIQPSFAEDGVVEFRISRGESFRGIGARLSQLGMVKSISVFKFYSLVSGNAQKFQPGVYELSRSMSVPRMVAVLTTVGKNEVTVTIPEGVGIRDVDRILSEAGVVEESAVLNYQLERLVPRYPFLEEMASLEGFLFPDTYRFELDSSADNVLIRFLDNFNEKAWSVLGGEEDWYERLIMASYLEREVPDFNDRRLVAGILLKRIGLGMPLQLDATISYAKCNGRLVGCSSLRVKRDDLSLSSPYNTYQRLGWTPTPISNPGSSAIKGAMTPESSSYLFYLSASETRQTIFSRTLEEHNRNRVKYL